MELPAYHWPNARHLALGLLERAKVFLRRVGTTILALMVILWALSSFPAPPPGATGAAIEYSIAGQIGALLAHVLEPVGFNWQISIALVSGLAAREVAVGALGTVYSMSAAAGQAGEALLPVIAAQWSLATGLALLAWYVFAPQCLVHARRREARDRRLAHADPDGDLPVRAGLHRRVRHVPHGARARSLRWRRCSTCLPWPP